MRYLFAFVALVLCSCRGPDHGRSIIDRPGTFQCFNGQMLVTVLVKRGFNFAPALRSPVSYVSLPSGSRSRAVFSAFFRPTSAPFDSSST